MYLIRLSQKAEEDIPRLKRENPKLAAKILDLILNIGNTPFDGLGKPEALKGDLQGWWSRRITDKHRLVYRINENILDIASCYGHYDDK